MTARTRPAIAAAIGLAVGAAGAVVGAIMTRLLARPPPAVVSPDDLVISA